MSNANDPGEAAVPAGYRLGDGWEVMSDELCCLPCPRGDDVHEEGGFFRRSDEAGCCRDCAVNFGALVPIEPPVAERPGFRVVGRSGPDVLISSGTWVRKRSDGPAQQWRGELLAGWADRVYDILEPIPAGWADRVWQRALPDGRVVLVERATAISMTEHWPELPTDAGTGAPVGPCVHCKEIRPSSEVDHWERCPDHPARLMVDSLRAQLSDMGKTVDRLNEEANHWHGVARNTSSDAGTGAVTSGEAVDAMTGKTLAELRDMLTRREVIGCGLSNAEHAERLGMSPQADAIKAAVASERERCLWWARARIERGILPLGALIDDIADGHAVPSGADAPGAGKP